MEVPLSLRGVDDLVWNIILEFLSEPSRKKITNRKIIPNQTRWWFWRAPFPWPSASTSGAGDNKNLCACCFPAVISRREAAVGTGAALDAKTLLWYGMSLRSLHACCAGAVLVFLTILLF